MVEYSTEVCETEISAKDIVFRGIATDRYKCPKCGHIIEEISDGSQNKVNIYKCLNVVRKGCGTNARFD